MASSNPKKYDFTGKVALVTGSSSGIGAAIAIQFSQFGAQVAIHGRDAAALEAIAAEVEKISPGGHKPLQIIGDLVADETLPVTLIQQTVEKFGRLDFLVNNAGGGSPHSSVTDEKVMEAYEKVFGLNVRAVIDLTRLAVPHLENTKGNIINISSIAGIRPYSTIYSASKAAVDMVTKGSAQDLASKGIRVNSINPGPVKTGFLRSINMDASLFEREETKNMTLLRFIPEPVEIANLASFLASDDARNITGSIIVSDTGCLIVPPNSLTRSNQN